MCHRALPGSCLVLVLRDQWLGSLLLESAWHRSISSCLLAAAAYPRRLALAVQLMELAGLSVACSLAAEYSLGAHKRVLVVSRCAQHAAIRLW